MNLQNVTADAMIRVPNQSATVQDRRCIAMKCELHWDEARSLLVITIEGAEEHPITLFVSPTTVLDMFFETLPIGVVLMCKNDTYDAIKGYEQATQFVNMLSRCYKNADDLDQKNIESAMRAAVDGLSK
jgi:hypothetical protein